MNSPKLISFLAIFFLVLSGSKCQNDPDKKIISKIEFDHKAIDDKGLINSEVAIDYEFCIPKDDAKVAEVKKIEPGVQMPRMAKGRIGCSDTEWLCIVSTNGPGWKERLYAIASLPYVKRIVQTHYE